MPTTTPIEIIRRRILARMPEVGLTSYDSLAKTLGKGSTRQNVHTFLTASTVTAPRLSTLVRYALALDWTLADLLGDEMLHDTDWPDDFLESKSAKGRKPSKAKAKKKKEKK